MGYPLGGRAPPTPVPALPPTATPVVPPGNGRIWHRGVPASRPTPPAVAARFCRSPHASSCRKSFASTRVVRMSTLLRPHPGLLSGDTRPGPRRSRARPSRRAPAIRGQSWALCGRRGRLRDCVAWVSPRCRRAGPERSARCGGPSWIGLHTLRWTTAWPDPAPGSRNPQRDCRRRSRRPVPPVALPSVVGHWGRHRQAKL